MKVNKSLTPALAFAAISIATQPVHAIDLDDGWDAVKGVAEDAIKVVNAAGAAADAVTAIAEKVEGANSTVGLAVNTALLSASNTTVDQEATVKVGTMTIEQSIVGAISNAASLSIDNSTVTNASTLSVGNVDIEGSAVATGIFTAVVEANSLTLDDAEIFVGDVTFK